MKKFFVSLFFIVVVFAVFADNAGRSAPLSAPLPQTKRLNWYKGNTHTHTINSDGDSTPDEVTRWYREHGYNFLVLTDHNFVTGVDGLNAVHGAEEKFIVVRGEEVSDKFGDKQIHVNGLNVERFVKPPGGKSVVEIVQRIVNEIRAARGVPHINHPNFGWAMTADDLKKVENNRLFEIYNGHPLVNNLGGGGQPGLEEIWDQILSSGKLLYGIAVDDAHHFKDPWNKNSSRPGQGWVVVRAATLSPPAILEALENGDFYASTGVELTDYQVDEKRMSVDVRQVRTSKYRVQFIGKNGRLLKEEIGNPAVYSFRGDESYVRAKIIESNGNFAWTQPVMFDKR